MKLIEFEVGDATSRSPCGCDAITARAIGIGSVAIGFAGTPCCKNHGVGGKCLNAGAGRIEQIGTANALSCFDDINEATVLKKRDVAGLFYP